MSTAHRLQYVSSTFKFSLLIALLSMYSAAPRIAAQQTTSASEPEALPIQSTPSSSTGNATALLDLPDAPGNVLSTSNDESQSSQSNTPPPQPGQPSKSVKPASIEHRLFGLGTGDAERASHMASTTDKYILPGQLAPKLTTGDKIEFGFIHGVSAYGVLGWFASAGYSHIINTSPNYGTDRGAFGERLGAAALRGYSNEVLKDSLMANVFHQDPRYYKMGPKRNVAVRTAYAISRTLVTRNDNGSLAPNYSLIGGNLLGSALTNAYYPDVNRGFGQTARTFGSSMYGTAFSFFASEFISGALEAVHLGESK